MEQATETNGGTGTRIHRLQVMSPPNTRRTLLLVLPLLLVFLVFYQIIPSMLLLLLPAISGRCGATWRDAVAALKCRQCMCRQNSNHHFSCECVRQEGKIWYDNVIFRDNDFIFFYFVRPRSVSAPLFFSSSVCSVCTDLGTHCTCGTYSYIYFTIADICFFPRFWRRFHGVRNEWK